MTSCFGGGSTAASCGVPHVRSRMMERCRLTHMDCETDLFGCVIPCPAVHANSWYHTWSHTPSFGVACALSRVRINQSTWPWSKEGKCRV